MKLLNRMFFLTNGKLTLVTIFIYSCAVSNNVFMDAVQTTLDSTYAYTPNNPVFIKEGDLYSSIEAENYYLKHLITINNEKLIYVMRGSIENPTKKHGISFPTRDGSSLHPGGDGYIIDAYFFKIENKSDTVILYLNPYKKGIVYAPVGFKFIPWQKN